MTFRTIPQDIKNTNDMHLFHNEIRKVLDPGVDTHTETINGKVFTFKKGVLVSVK